MKQPITGKATKRPAIIGKRTAPPPIAAQRKTVAPISGKAERPRIVVKADRHTIVRSRQK